MVERAAPIEANDAVVLGRVQGWLKVGGRRWMLLPAFLAATLDTSILFLPSSSSTNDVLIHS